ncbi:cytochrome b/b6 domain-containing protein [Granulosicoccus sp.]|nr:cytochrome b/b6 domain-containing protein [Granulosicoccus sp.]MDB4224352.1 cytochrome b/b6 domain-containing protein [Granulosicoccus sp.]
MNSDTQTIRIWDLWIRLFHWSLAATIVFLLVSGETGWMFFEWHRTAGEIALTLVVFRLFWGIFGSSNARLLKLIKSPASAIVHLGELFKRKLPQERGHNAAGGWAVLLVLVSITAQAITGQFIADEEEFIEGAYYGAISGDLTDLMYTVHMRNAQLLQIFVIVHVAMVFIYLIYARVNLIFPMFTGSMKWTGTQKVPDVVYQGNWVGLIFAIVSVVAIAYVVGWVG